MEGAGGWALDPRTRVSVRCWSIVPAGISVLSCNSVITPCTEELRLEITGNIRFAREFKRHSRCNGAAGFGSESNRKCCGNGILKCLYFLDRFVRVLPDGDRVFPVKMLPNSRIYH